MTTNPYSKYYPTPLRSDDYSYIWTAGGNMAFDWQDELTLPPTQKTNIVLHLNGESTTVPGFTGRFILGPEEIDDPEQPIDWSENADARHNTIWYCEGDEVHCLMRVRGWGHLTGCGGLNLPPEDAARIQDGFLDWAVARLNERDFPEATELGMASVSLTFDRELARKEYEAISELKHERYVSHIETDDSTPYDPDESKYTDTTDVVWHVYNKSADYSVNEHISIRTNNQPWYARFNGKRRRRKR